MSITPTEGKKMGNDSITALTKEGLNVDLDITVLYHLVEDRASDVYKNLGLNYEEKVIRPAIRASIREVVAQYEAKDIYSEKREEATLGLENYLKQTIEDRGIEVEQVLLRNVNLPEKLANSIQEKLQAEQEAQRMKFVLEKESQEAERKRIEAAGQRDAQKIINESLSEQYLDYLYINSLKDRQGTIYVPTSPSSGMPVFKNIP
jgi:regulator of protease activity HflC (stomatin/prohibitin superfamily)